MSEASLVHSHFKGSQEYTSTGLGYPQKWRTITELSFPEGDSVNDVILSQLCSLLYITVDEVVAVAAALGQGSLMAKTSAYRLIPVRPQDRLWLGV